MSHSMQRRNPGNNYRNPGFYHITISVCDRKHQSLSTIVGDVQQPDGHPDAPKVELTAIGKMVEDELLRGISSHYPVVEVQDYVVMPEHVHFIVHVKNSLISKNGRHTHLGQVIAGFKEGCNRRYWALTGQQGVAAKPLPTKGAPSAPAPSAPHAAAGSSGPMPAGGFATSTPAPCAPAPSGLNAAPAPSGPMPAGPHAAPASSGSLAAGGFATSTPAPHAAPGPSGPVVAGGFATSTPAPGADKKSRYSFGREPLFSSGYVDVIPFRPGQLETQRSYIRANPRNRLLRTQSPSLLHPRRNSFDTLVTPNALRGYLIRERALAEDDAPTWQALVDRLLLAGGHVVCDSYGHRALAERQLLPVVCHRKDKASFAQHKQACLTAAAAGAVLVSARIAPGEQEIIDEAIAQGHPVVLVVDNGFPAIYHPSEARLQLCTARRLLLLTPWIYQYRHANEDITVAQCKAMNCVVQALCRLRDDWWHRR